MDYFKFCLIALLQQVVYLEANSQTTSNTSQSLQITSTFSTIAAQPSTPASNWTGLDCSAFGVNSTNASLQQLTWSARLHACFQANPYDITQPPLTAWTPSYVTLFYDYSVVYVIEFDGTRISLIGQLTIQWTDYFRMWDPNTIPIYTLQIPLSEIWYPPVLFLSTVKKRSIELLNSNDIAVLSTTLAGFVKRNVIEGHCEVDIVILDFHLTLKCAL